MAGARGRETAWREVGRELDRLHTMVLDCPDPHGWLDDPTAGRGYTAESLLCRLACVGEEGNGLAGPVRRLLNAGGVSPGRIFVHGDTNGGNVLCHREGGLMALIDWGDAGWADPAVDFYMVPPEGLEAALRGYGETAPVLLTEPFLLQVLADKIWEGLQEGVEPKQLGLQMRDLEERLSALL